MKTNIKKNGMWWSWKGICDRCGKPIDEDWCSTEEPDAEEVDFCVHCINYFLDAGIPYKVAKQRHKKDGAHNG